MNTLQPYVAFARVLEAGSFSAVAREMGTSQSAISKQIAALERSLGIQLFARTTRRLQPTSEALDLYEHVKQLLDAIEGLKSAGDCQPALTGTLKITMPSSYGRRRLRGVLSRFLDMHPQVRIDMLLTDQVVDLVAEGLELGIRIGDLPPSTLMARPIETVRQRLVATPAYLAGARMPEAPAELAEHACIVYSSSPQWSRWEFESESGRQAVSVNGPALANDPEMMYELVLADRGIALIPEWILGKDIEQGRVRWLLQDYYPFPLPVNIVYPQTRFLSQRARSFIDFVISELQNGA